jgi:hypothetical protein
MRLGQAFIDVKPQVSVPISAPISIELGGLPLSIGFFAGSASVFLIRTALAKGWLKDVALVAGSLLAVGGVANLLMPKKAVAAPAVPAGPTPAPQGSPGAPVAQVPYSASETLAFGNIVGSVVSPLQGTTVNIGAFSSSYPVRAQFYNPTDGPVAFEAEIIAEETPVPFGDPKRSALPIQVSLGPREAKNYDVQMPIAAWGTFVDHTLVLMTLYKRRVTGEALEILDARQFTVD